MADLRSIVGNAAATSGNALDPITFRLRANEVRTPGNVTHPCDLCAS